MESARLRYRPYKPEDDWFFMSLCLDPDVMRHIGDGRVRGRKEIGEWFQNVLARSRTGFGPWVVEKKDTGEPVGQAGLVKQILDGKEEWEIGYWMKKSCWGKGYASEAAATFRDFALLDLRLDRVISIIQPANIASIRVAVKIGMSLERHTRFQGIPVAVYSLQAGKTGEDGGF
ncbi:GNAT family N-acetyltransferase [Staphylospora marina]|uniref:GNAT family N-acetyltransferase n=1 Tax=Staphylospora marina TaxID=2490858 RepID=UPI0013DDAF81|nr:GNAT family N-acetyltransferase [Staphylospora marina]